MTEPAALAPTAGTAATDAGKPRIPPVLIIGAIAFVVALVMVYLVSARGSFADSEVDAYGYGEMGRSVARGDGFAGFGVVLDRRGPFYPIVLGGVFFLFGEHDRAALLLNCFMFAGTAMFAFDMARRHFNQRAGIIAGLCCTFHPFFLRYLPTLHVETMLTFLTTLTVWCSYRFYKRPSVWNGIFVGVAAGLTALTKAVIIAYPAVFVVAIYLVYRAARRRGEQVRTPWAPMIAVLAGLVLTLAPWTIRNYIRTDGHIVPVTTGTADSFLRSFHFSEWKYATLQEPPYTGAENASNIDLDNVVTEAGAVWRADDIETDKILQEEALKRLREQPGRVAEKYVVGAFTFWYQLTSLSNSLLVGFLAVVAWVFAIIGWRQARREHLAVWPFFLPVLYMNLVLAMITSVGRYSVPVLPALFVVSAFGIDTLLRRWRSRDATTDAEAPAPTPA